jgi:hypothetical protein
MLTAKNRRGRRGNRAKRGKFNILLFPPSSSSKSTYFAGNAS